MRFEHSEYLWLLVIIPILFFLFFLAKRNLSKKIDALGKKQLIEQLIPNRSNKKGIWKFILLIFGLALMIIGLANPQVGSKQEKVKRKGIDVAIALDLSKSMLSEDIRPNRLERARRFISSLIDKFESDRVAFIIFAGNAYLQMPLTIDYSAFELYLRTVGPKIIPTQGTAIGEAIELAEQAFEAGQKKHKALIIISDGENHDEGALALAKTAAQNGTKIYTIGVGTPKGGPIPIYNKYGEQTDYKKDNDGSIVLSKLNEKMLQELAVNGNGQYFRLSGRETVTSIMKEISQMETKEIEELVYTDYEDQFQYFLFFGLLLIAAEVFISSKKSRLFNKWNLFEARENEK